MGPVSFFCIWVSSFPNTIVEKTVLSQLNGLGTLVEDRLTIYVSTYTDFVDGVIDIEV